MKTTYSAGKYEMETNEGAIYRMNLNKAQAKSLFQFQRKGYMDITRVELIEESN